LSTFDDEVLLVIQNRHNLISSTTTKKRKTDDACDNCSNDIETIIEDDAEIGEILFDL